MADVKIPHKLFESVVQWLNGSVKAFEAKAEQAENNDDKTMFEWAAKEVRGDWVAMIQLHDKQKYERRNPGKTSMIKEWDGDARTTLMEAIKQQSEYKEAFEVVFSMLSECFGASVGVNPPGGVQNPEWSPLFDALYNGLDVLATFGDLYAKCYVTWECPLCGHVNEDYDPYSDDNCGQCEFEYRDLPDASA